MKSEVLKPLTIYGKLTVDEVQERNKLQARWQIWRLKEAMVHDSKRRIGMSPCCITRTISRHNAPAGTDEWQVYYHLH